MCLNTGGKANFETNEKTMSDYLFYKMLQTLKKIINH
jgi:hypothetical protein